MIKLIWAQTPENVIGDNNMLPWSIKDEMVHFKKTTLNSNVLMGRKTFESMGSVPLPKRVNYVISSKNLKYKNTENLIFIQNIKVIEEKFKSNGNEDIYVIGGASLIKETITIADEIIKTTIKKEYKGNIVIENFNLSNFDKIKTIEHDQFYIEYFKRR